MVAVGVWKLPPEGVMYTVKTIGQWASELQSYCSTILYSTATMTQWACIWSHGSDSILGTTRIATRAHMLMYWVGLNSLPAEKAEIRP